jgi:2-haloalkanoic acid dehalogenase type II
MLYSDLLAAVYATLAREWGVDAPDEECAAFGAGIPHWPVFPDSPPSLQYLKRHYRLVILSNVDRASFAGSNEKLQVEFDAIYTAEDIGSYKPDARNFDYLLEHLKADFAFDRTDVLHTAQSLFHDHVPARALGLATAWIDRRQDKPGWGATAPPPTDVRPDFHFNSLVALVEAHQDETRATRS